MFIKSFPDEIDLLGFFESEPVASDVSDLYFSYKTNDEKGVEIVFSFCVTAGWMTTIISYNGVEISKFLTENINEIKLKKDTLGEYLYSEVITDELITKIEIRTRPYISVRSNSLVR